MLVPANRFRCLVAAGPLVVAVLALALLLPAGARGLDLSSTVCRGITGCSPMVTGWISAPGGTLSKPGTVETELTCPGNEIAVNFGATDSQPGFKIDVTVDAVLVALNGIPYGRTFDAANSGPASTFQVAIGCVAIGAPTTGVGAPPRHSIL
jgi:hypothetical protein